MAKFKVGDYITQVMYADIYKVTNYIGGYYSLEKTTTKLTHVDATSVVDATYILVSTLSQQSQPGIPATQPTLTQGKLGNVPSGIIKGNQFNYGDIVITKWGNELQITAIDHHVYEYFYRILKSNNQAKVGTTDKESFAIAHAIWKLKSEAFENLKPDKVTVYEKQCTCDSKVLFNRGCICGSVKKYKSSFGA